MTRELRVECGSLLAAWPDLMDPNFMHSVVAVCQHTELGAHGLVTNRLTDYSLGDLFPTHPILEKSSFAVHLGGPVDHSTMQFLHTVPDAIPGGLCLDGTLWLGGEFEAMASFVAASESGARQSLRVFLGYSGWGAGQLEMELGAGSWIPAPPLIEAVFGPEGESTWRRVVRSIGDRGIELEHEPPDVSWN